MQSHSRSTIHLKMGAIFPLTNVNVDFLLFAGTWDANLVTVDNPVIQVKASSISSFSVEGYPYLSSLVVQQAHKVYVTEAFRSSQNSEGFTTITFMLYSYAIHRDQLISWVLIIVWAWRTWAGDWFVQYTLSHNILHNISISNISTCIIPNIATLETSNAETNAIFSTILWGFSTHALSIWWMYSWMWKQSCGKLWPCRLCQNMYRKTGDCDRQCKNECKLEADIAEEEALILCKETC